MEQKQINLFKDRLSERLDNLIQDVGKTVNGMSRSHRASTPPNAANGTPVPIIKASRTDRVLRYSKKRMAPSASGTMIISLALARWRCSNWPPSRV